MSRCSHHLPSSLLMNVVVTQVLITLPPVSRGQILLENYVMLDVRIESIMVLC